MFVTVADSCTGQDRPGRLRSHRRAFRSVQHKNYQSWNENYPELSNCPLIHTKIGPSWTIPFIQKKTFMYCPNPGIVRSPGGEGGDICCPGPDGREVDR